MKILHFSFHYKISAGIVNQIEAESLAAAKLDKVVLVNKVFTVYGKEAPFCEITHRPVGKYFNYLICRLLATVWLWKHRSDFDYILLRHNLGDPFEWLMSLFINRYATVHHTFEYEEAIAMGGIRGRIHLLLEKFFGQKVIKRAHAIIGVTDEIVDYQLRRVGFHKPSYIYPNGIRIDNRKLEDGRSGVPKFIFVAAYFAKWHGLERLLSKLKDVDTPCELHIVGLVSPEQIQLISDDSRVIYHGEMSSENITKLCVNMDVGLSSFALEEKGMQVACTLKVREYLSLGIPVFSGHRDSGLPDSFEYYRHGQISITKIINFSNEMREVSRENIKNKALKFIDKNRLVDDLAVWVSGMSD